MLMSRSKRIKTLVDLAGKELEASEQMLRDVRLQRDQVGSQLNELVRYLDEYMANLTSSNRGYLPIQIQTTQAFTDKIRQAVISQQQKLEAFEEIVQKAETQWLDKRVRHKALSKVYQRLVKNEQDALSKAEQKWLDDLAAQNFLR